MRNSQLGFTRFRPLAVAVLLASGQFLQAAPEVGWSNGPDLPFELVRATGVYFPANGRFYAMGGRTSEAAGAGMTTPYEYNLKTNTWSFKTAPFPDDQVNNMACGVLSDSGTPYIYCIGGTAAGNNTVATKRVFRYNPATDTIQTAGLDPWKESAPNTLPGGFTVFENKLYVLGGLTLGTGATNRIFEFTPSNPVGSQWVQKNATLPLALGFVPATTVGNSIFTAGGYSGPPCSMKESQNSYAYDPVADSISPIANIPRVTGETRAVAVGNEMWVLGGGRTVSSRSTEVSIYNPSTGEWRVGLPFGTGQRSFAADSDGTRVFVAGGYNATAVPVKTTQIYHGAPQISSAPILMPDAPSLQEKER